MTTFTILSSLLSLLTLLALSPSPSLANSHIPNVGRHLHHREYIDYYHSSPSLSKRKYKVKRDGNSTGLDPNPNLGGFTEVGNSGVSAQMMFLGTPNTVFILDSEFLCAPEKPCVDRTTFRNREQLNAGDHASRRHSASMGYIL